MNLEKMLMLVLISICVLPLVGCGGKCDIALFHLELTSIELIHGDTGENLDSEGLLDDRHSIETTLREGELEKTDLGFILDFESGSVYVYK